MGHPLETHYQSLVEQLDVVHLVPRGHAHTVIDRPGCDLQAPHMEKLRQIEKLCLKSDTHNLGESDEVDM